MSDDRAWSLTCDEFAWIWRAHTDRDEFYFPDPIDIRETATTEAEHWPIMTACAKRYPKDDNPWLTAAFTTLAEPRDRIRAYGTLPTGEQLRVHGAITSNLGVVVVQRCQGIGQVGPILVFTCRPESVATYVARALPPAQPGGAGRMDGYAPRVRGEGPNTSYLPSADGRLPTDERIRHLLLRIPREAEGHFVIESAVNDPRPYAPHYLNWIDIPPGQFASGRYLITVQRDDVTVLPADNDVIATELRSRLRADTPAQVW
ncbi:ESX secretion-associated protein EspG [Nocardia sp. NPDC058666]|uniref:ESX secretion-associated protein EspG n=1 Tax=Nocardia sp. NPDC058666 TaxID=3346587 RepID=UPI003655FB9C